MSRWAHDPEGAADALILRSLDDIEVAGRVLLACQSPALVSAVRERGAEVVVWTRRLAAEGPVAAPWPPDGPFDLALVRLPKAREEQAMSVHAALAVLRPRSQGGGRLIVYGGNDEGVRTVPGMLEEVAGDVVTLAVRGHGRVLAAVRPELEGDAAEASAGGKASRLRASLAAWRSVSRFGIAGQARDWLSYPGCFAGGGLDEGTALLLSSLPRLQPGTRVLDYGCGIGVIAGTVLAGQPDLKVDVLDNDAVALEAVRENVPAAARILGARLADVGRRRYGAILSNPPLHQGIAEDRTLLDGLIVDAPKHLSPGGYLQLVVQRRVPLDRLLRSRFGKVETVTENGRYRVWRAQAAA